MHKTPENGIDPSPEDQNEAESREEKEAGGTTGKVKDAAGAEADAEDKKAGEANQAPDPDESPPSEEKAGTGQETEDGNAPQPPAAAEAGEAEAGEEPTKPDEAEAGPGIEELKKQHEAQLRSYKEKMYRIAADFENYKKRTQREFGEREDRAKADVIKVILPTVDNLKRAVDHSSQAKDVQSVVEGLKIVEKSFLDTLTKAGIRKLRTEGEAFDPTYHEAIAQAPSPDVPAGTIMKEIQPGYLLNEKLLRAPLVVVSSGPPEGGEAPKEPEEEAAVTAQEAEGPQRPEEDDDIKDPEEVCVQEPAEESPAELSSREVICSRIISLEASAEAEKQQQENKEKKPEETGKPKAKLTDEEKERLKEKLELLEQEKKKAKEQDKGKSKVRSRKKTTSRKKKPKNS
ncbi:MAG: nucleotide exchange factor GrpE [Pseudomonadota bacterium]